MKILKKILLAIVFLIVLLLVIALFVNKDYTVQRDIVIKKPKTDVFNYVKLLQNEAHYNVWAMKDPNAKVSLMGTDGTPGCIRAWDSDNSHVGKGSQEITKVSEGERIDCNLHFEKPFKGEATTFMATESSSDNETKLTWQMSGHSAYPMNFMNLFMNSMLGSDMNASLATLKGILEK